MSETPETTRLIALLAGAFLWLATATATASTKSSNVQLRKLYQQGYTAFAAAQYTKARAAFKALLPLLKRTQKSQHTPNSRDWHMMSFGRFDVLYHLAQIAQRQKQAQRACRYYHRAEQAVATIPSTWTSWKVNPNIPVRLQETQQQMLKCKALPGYLTLKALPPQTTVEKQIGPGQWQTVKADAIPVLKPVVTLKLSAPGHQSKVFKNIRVERWKTKTMTLRLEKKPAPRRVVVVRRQLPPPRRLPPPTPVTKKWWFWVAVGAGVAVVSGVAIGVGVYAAQPPTDVLNGPGGGSIRIW